MERDEILEKSRNENKNQDVFEQQVTKEAANIGAVAALIAACVFFVIQIVVGLGINYGLYAIVFWMQAGAYGSKAWKMRRKKDVISSVLALVAAVLMSAAHIVNLVTSSKIL